MDSVYGQDICYGVPDLPTLQAMQRLLRGLEAIPDMRGLEAIDEPLWSRVREFTHVKSALAAYLRSLLTLQRVSDLERQWKRVDREVRKMPEVKANQLLLEKNPQMLLQKYPNSQWIRSLVEAALKDTPKPLSRGHSAKTLTAAALVEDFKCRKMQSRYRQAATLLYEASPELFPNLTGEDAPNRLGRLVRSVPEDIRKREHAEWRSMFSTEEPEL